MNDPIIFEQAGREVLRITPDGGVKVADDLTQDEAVRAFWQIVQSTANAGWELHNPSYPALVQEMRAALVLMTAGVSYSGGYYSISEERIDAVWAAFKRLTENYS